MKYLNFYKNKGIDKDNVFNYFISNIKMSIKTWPYFVNWEKVSLNVDELKIELNILNSLIGCDNLKKDFKELVLKYPNVIKTLPALLAVRNKKLNIIRDYENHDLSTVEFDFSEKKFLTEKDAEKYFEFIEKSKLIELFKNKKIKNFVDYVFGVEVGLDTNGRKNRGGQLMEDILEVFIKDFISCNDHIEFITQATASKIMQKWNYRVLFDKSSRRYDFAIYNKKMSKIFLVEANFYNGGGSKLKAVCGEFKSLNNELKKQGIDLIWITDGKGWLTTKRPLEETFNHNDYVFNLEMIEDNILKEVICS